MYEALDKFTNIDTWHTTHPLDEERFYKALHQIVKEPDFNADEMAEHMRQKTGADRKNEDHAYAKAIERYQSAAWAVREYLAANKLLTD